MKATILMILSIVVNTVFAQNIGIGTLTPAKAKLEIIGVAGTGRTVALFGSDIAGISLQRNWPTVGFNQYRNSGTGNGIYQSSGFAAIQYLDPTTGNFAIDMLGTGATGTNTITGTRAININATGVGIRNVLPSASLHVSRGDGADGTAVIAGYQHWSHFNYSATEDTYIRAGADNGTLYVNNIPNGNIFLGNGSSEVQFSNTNASQNCTIVAGYNTGGNFQLIDGYYNNYWSQTVLDYSNTGSYDIVLKYKGVFKGRWESNYGIYIQSSDARLKTNFAHMQPVLKKLNSLHPSMYEMKYNNPDHRQSIGMIAQDVQKQFPLLVHADGDHGRGNTGYKNLLSLGYSGLFVICIKALQEQNAELEQLREEQQELMQRIQKLKKRVNN